MKPYSHQNPKKLKSNSTSSSENSTNGCKLYLVVEINTIIHLTREHVSQKPDKGVKDANHQLAAQSPLAIMITTSDEHDANTLSNSAINDGDLGATCCTSNTPISNGDVMNENLCQELESVKEVVQEHELLCMLWYSKVTKEMERLQNEFIGQDIDNDQFLSTVQGALDQAIETSDSCAKLLEEGIKLLKEACDR